MSQFSNKRNPFRGSHKHHEISQISQRRPLGISVGGVSVNVGGGSASISAGGTTVSIGDGDSGASSGSGGGDGGASNPHKSSGGSTGNTSHPGSTGGSSTGSSGGSAGSGGTAPASGGSSGNTGNSPGDSGTASSGNAGSSGDSGNSSPPASSSGSGNTNPSTGGNSNSGGGSPTNADPNAGGSDTTNGPDQQSSSDGNTTTNANSSESLLNSNGENSGDTTSSGSPSVSPSGIHPEPSGSTPTVGTIGSPDSSAASAYGNATNNSSTSASAASSRHGHVLSGGAIAGITLTMLLFLLLSFIVIARRRAQKHRRKLRMRWFFSREKPSVDFDAKRMIRQSQRSSWGTPAASDFYEDLPECMSPTFGNTTEPLPLLPPMQHTGSPLISPPPVVTMSNTHSDSRKRDSALSASSSRSSHSFHDEEQVLTVPEAAHGEDMPSTPMTVRPFSPSEHFSFPKPPGSTTSTLSSAFSPTRMSKTGDNPFTDPPMSPSPAVQTFNQVHSVASSYVAVGSTRTSEWPTYRAGTESSTNSIGIGTRAIVTRPFERSLHDELSVSPGESLLVIRAFDDGWTQVRNENNEIGLIPIDCFREKGEAVPAFLACKRISSFFKSGSLLN